MILWITAALTSFFIKGLCGFANTLVFDAILSFGVNNISISPVELVLGSPTNFILAWQGRKHLKPRLLLLLCTLVLAGSIPGAFLLKNLNAQLIKVVFGVVVTLLGIEMLYQDAHPEAPKMPPMVLGAIGLLAGLSCGMFGVGAPLAAYVGQVTDSSASFKANLAAVFCVENIFRVISYVSLGIVTTGTLLRSVTLVPFMLLGLFAGIKCSEHLDDKLVKRVVIWLLILSGIILIVKNI